MSDLSIPGVLPSDVAAGTRPRNRRETIGRVAATLFAERGFENVRMDDIAAASGITVRALYRHYSNKLALLGELVESSQWLFVSALDADETPSADRFGAAVGRLIVASRETSDFAVLWQREARYLEKTDYRRLRDRLTGMVVAVAEIIDEELPGLIRFQRDIRAWAVISAVVSPAVTNDAAAVVAASSVLVTMWSSPQIRAMPVDLVERAADPDLGRRERLLASAGQNFAMRGFAFTGIDDIGSLAGVSGPSLYRHFSSKGDLLDVLIRRRTSLLWFELDDRWDSGGVDQRLSAIVEAYVVAGVRNPHLVAVWVTELGNVAEEVRQDVVASMTSFRGTWIAVLRRMRPELSAAAATNLVAIVVQIVDDVVRIRRIVTDENCCRELIGLVYAILTTAWPDTSAAAGASPRS